MIARFKVPIQPRCATSSDPTYTPRQAGHGLKEGVLPSLCRLPHSLQFLTSDQVALWYSTGYTLPTRNQQARRNQKGAYHIAAGMERLKITRRYRVY